jgi:hypothetical protein
MIVHIFELLVHPKFPQLRQLMQSERWGLLANVFGKDAATQLCRHFWSSSETYWNSDMAV